MILPRELLISAFQAALDAANPLILVPRHLPIPPKGRTLVIGGGKAAAAMAQAVEENWPAEAPLSGMVVTRYGHGQPTSRIRVIEAGHPLPDDQGAEAARHMLREIQQLDRDDLLLVLLSGGGSSLLALPETGIDMDDLRTVTKALLTSGASIKDINTVRKHLTQSSGGRVAALSAAPVVSLIISDVVGDDPTHIASGPCAPDPATYDEALATLSRHSISPNDSIMNHLLRGLRGEIPETPKPGDFAFRNVENHVIGSAAQSLKAAESLLDSQGFHVINLGEIEGEARELASQHATMLRECRLRTDKPLALLSGGEATVTVRNPTGHGGRNSEYLLALGLALKDAENFWAIACDTDGIDGTEDNAGAIWAPDTFAQSIQSGLNAEEMLHANNAQEFFRSLDKLVMTGPTRTNVNDFRLALLI
jgi:hydroxypyruvate reductase